MTDRFVIVQATHDDVPRVEEMVHAAYEKYIPRMNKRPAPMCADYHAFVDERTLYVLKDLQTSSTCGSIVLIHSKRTVEVNSVVVDPAVQGRGYGNQLMTFAETKAREVDASCVTLYTNEKMVENVQYYKKLGYTEVERRTEQGYSRVYFRKNVT